MGRHELQLQCSYDGAIPPWLLRRARELDAAEDDALPSRVHGAPIVRPPGRAQKLARMAAMMVERAADGACTEADLAAAGFTRADLDALGDAARAIALATVSAREAPPRSRGPRRGTAS